MDTFHRPALADQLAARIVDPPAMSAFASGLFLSAPRRTGKSTFIREDLRPALEEAGSLVIYADLWADRSRDPGDLLVAAIRDTLRRHEGVITKAARAAGLDKATVGGLSFSIDRVGLGQDVSLTAALAALSDHIKRPIAFIIDEAQHAITTEKGLDATFALKAARDELNSSAHYGLRIVATGSNREKLAMLRASKDQAFFGAPMSDFPTLGADFIDWLVDRLPFGRNLDKPSIFEWFAQSGYRPEVLQGAIAQLFLQFALPSDGYSECLRELMQNEIEQMRKDTLKLVRSLTPLQRAVLVVMAEEGEAFAPFEASTRKLYESEMGSASDDEISSTSIQRALESLQTKGLVWRAARGVYAIEDSHTADALLAQRS